MITILLMNYKREENLPRIISDLRNQSIRCEIFLWNNAPTPFHHEEVDWVVNSSKNVRCWARWSMAQFATNDWIMTLDDDLTLGDSESLAYLLEQANRYYKAGRAFGLFGVQYNGDKKYQRPKEKQGVRKDANIHHDLPERNTPVDIIKGRCFLFRKEDLKALPHTPDHAIESGDDLVASYYLAKRRPRHHLLIGNMSDRIVELPGGQDEMALSATGDWNEIRSEITTHYFQHLGSKRI